MPAPAALLTKDGESGVRAGMPGKPLAGSMMSEWRARALPVILPLSQIGNGSIDIRVVTGDQRFVIQRDRQLGQPREQLAERGAGLCQRLGSAVDHDQLKSIDRSNDTTTQEPAIVRLIGQDMFVAAWHMLAMCIPGVKQLSVGENPEDEFRRGVREVLDGGTPTSESVSQKFESSCCFLASH